MYVFALLVFFIPRNRYGPPVLNAINVLTARDDTRKIKQAVAKTANSKTGWKKRWLKDPILLGSWKTTKEMSCEKLDLVKRMRTKLSDSGRTAQRNFIIY